MTSINADEFLAAGSDTRVDPYLRTVVHVVGSRQARPNLPTTGCPFCAGGLEAPDPYDVRWFPTVGRPWPTNAAKSCCTRRSTRPALPRSASTVPARSSTSGPNAPLALGARDDVDFVLVFENRGAEVGATIAHPHGQIYAYDHVPDRPRHMFDAHWAPDAAPGSRAVRAEHGWCAYVPFAPTYPSS